ncbi:MAG: GDSL-type esterase/lipase family protein [Hyphomicrobiaceae bacterium]
MRRVRHMARQVCRGLVFCALGLVVALVLALVGPAGSTPALAQSIDGATRTYVTPFPDNDVYRIVVFGDSMADELSQALAAALEDDTGVEVVNSSQPGAGLARGDDQAWDEIAAGLGRGQPMHLAVLMFGADDRTSIRIDKRRYQPDTRQWQAEYAERIDRLLRELKRQEVAVYWLGLPVMRSPAMSSFAEMANGIVRERALLAGVKYIDTWTGFADHQGAYSDYGPDMTGKVRELRADDGIHFTARGYQKLAHFVEQDIRRDLGVARAERDVPLAGDEDEQIEIHQALAVGGDTAPEGAAMAGGDATSGSGSVVALQGIQGFPADTSTIAVATSTGGDQPVTVTIELPRPEIPSAVVAHLLRSRAARQTDVGDTIDADLRGGLTALSSLTMTPRAAVARACHSPSRPIIACW